MKKINNRWKRVGDLLGGFFVKPKNIPSLLEPSNSIRKLENRVGLVSWGMNLIVLAFAFLLKLTNTLIENHHVYLGLACFMLYWGQNMISKMIDSWVILQENHANTIYQNEVIVTGAEIVGKTEGKVYLKNKKTDVFELMSNEGMLNTCKRFLETFWKYECQQKILVLKMFTVITMVLVAIITNHEVNQGLFVTLIIGFSIASFWNTLYVRKKRVDFLEKDKKCAIETHELVNDLLRVPNIVKRDLENKIDNLQKVSNRNQSNLIFFKKKEIYARTMLTVLEALCQFGIIIAFFAPMDKSQITVDSIVEVMAVLAIVQTAISNVRGVARTFNGYIERITILENEKEDMAEIMKVYWKEKKLEEESNEENNQRIKIPEVKIIHENETSSGKTYTLKTIEEIEINPNDVVFLTGPSGSGKTTFMKFVSRQFKLDGNDNLQIFGTRNYAWYHEKLRFGSGTLYDELFCGEENPDLNKMEEIFRNLHLWQEISEQCTNVWNWLKEIPANGVLSNGQNQRMIIAKILYWLDSQVNLVVLDECTSGLENNSDNKPEDAENILKYVIDYVNKDKQRSVLIATHQNVSNLMEKLKGTYTVKQLKFEKDGSTNQVKLV